MLQAQAAKLLAERLGLSQSEQAALMTGDMKSLFASRFANDPLAAEIMSAMGTGEAQSEEPVVERRTRARTLVREEADEALAGAAEALQAAKRMIRQVGRALGACRCWGRERACVYCHGRGAPGWKAPVDEDMFLAWVEPALEHLGLRVVPADPEEAVGARGGGPRNGFPAQSPTGPNDKHA